MNRQSEREWLRPRAFSKGPPRMRSLQDWTTIRSGVTSRFVREDELWRKTEDFVEVAFWFDVSSVTPPQGSCTIYAKLTLETVAAGGDGSFRPVASQIWLGSGAALPVRTASAAPFVVRSSRANAACERHLRWRVDPVGTGAWEIAFRVRAVFA